MKQSYLLSLWLYYYVKNFSSYKPTFTFKPKKNSKKTLIKAPMAHKTFSQEQFIFRVYNLVIKFKYKLCFLHFNASIYFVLYLHKMRLTFETNLLLLKHINFFFNVNGFKYLKL